MSVALILAAIAAFVWYLMRQGATVEAAKNEAAQAKKEIEDAHAIARFEDHAAATDARAEQERARVAPPDPGDVLAAARARDELARLLNGGRLPDAGPEARPPGQA